MYVYIYVCAGVKDQPLTNDLCKILSRRHVLLNNSKKTEIFSTSSRIMAHAERLISDPYHENK